MRHHYWPLQIIELPPRGSDCEDKLMFVHNLRQVIPLGTFRSGWLQTCPICHLRRPRRAEPHASIDATSSLTLKTPHWGQGAGSARYLSPSTHTGRYIFPSFRFADAGCASQVKRSGKTALDRFESSDQLAVGCSILRTYLHKTLIL